MRKSIVSRRLESRRMRPNHECSPGSVSPLLTWMGKKFAHVLDVHYLRNHHQDRMWRSNSPRRTPRSWESGSLTTTVRPHLINVTHSLSHWWRIRLHYLWWLIQEQNQSLIRDVTKFLYISRRRLSRVWRQTWGWESVNEFRRIQKTFGALQWSLPRRRTENHGE